MKKVLVIISALIIHSVDGFTQSNAFDITIDYQGIYEWGWSVLVVDSDSYLVTGSGGDSLFNNDGLIYNLKLNGELNSFNQISRDGHDFYVGLSGSAKKTLDNNFIVAGGVNKDNPLDQDALLVKYNQFGDTLFVKYYGNVFDNFYNSAILSDGGYALIGFTYNEIGGDANLLLGDASQDLWLVKLDSNGCLMPGCEINSTTFEVGDTLFSLSIFPNPAQDQTLLMYNVPVQEAKATISVFDLQGRRIDEFEIPSYQHHFTLNTQHYPAGVYIVELKTKDKALTKKLLKQ